MVLGWRLKRARASRGLAAALLLVGASLPAAELRNAWPMANLRVPEHPIALAWDAAARRLLVAQPGISQVSRVTPQGVTPLFPQETRLGEPREVLVMPDGRVVFACLYYVGNPITDDPDEPHYYALLHEFSPQGTFKTLQEPSGTHPALSFEASPPRLALGGEGELLLGLDTQILAWRAGTVRILAGTGDFGHAGDGGPALDASLSLDAMAVGPDGSIFIVGACLRERPVVRKLTRQVDGSYAIRAIDQGRAQAAPEQGPVTLFRNAITVDPEGRVFVLSGNGRQLEQFTPTRQGYAWTPLPLPRSVVNGKPVALHSLIAVGDDSFFALDDLRRKVLFIGPEGEAPLREAMASLASHLAAAARDPAGADPTPGITDHLRRLGRLLQTGGPSLTQLLHRREVLGRPLPAQAQAALARRGFRRALIKALLPKLGVPQAYLSSHEVDDLLAGIALDEGPAN